MGKSNKGASTEKQERVVRAYVLLAIGFLIFVSAMFRSDADLVSDIALVLAYQAVMFCYVGTLLRSTSSGFWSFCVSLPIVVPLVVADVGLLAPITTTLALVVFVIGVSELAAKEERKRAQRSSQNS